jgi:hypothetical protein
LTLATPGRFQVQEEYVEYMVQLFGEAHGAQRVVRFDGFRLLWAHLHDDSAKQAALTARGVLRLREGLAAKTEQPEQKVEAPDKRHRTKSAQLALDVLQGADQPPSTGEGEHSKHPPVVGAALAILQQNKRRLLPQLKLDEATTSCAEDQPAARTQPGRQEEAEEEDVVKPRYPMVAKGKTDGSGPRPKAAAKPPLTAKAKGEAMGVALAAAEPQAAAKPPPLPAKVKGAAVAAVEGQAAAAARSPQPPAADALDARRAGVRVRSGAHSDFNGDYAIDAQVRRQPMPTVGWNPLANRRRHQQISPDADWHPLTSAN